MSELLFAMSCEMGYYSFVFRYFNAFFTTFAYYSNRNINGL